MRVIIIMTRKEIAESVDRQASGLSKSERRSVIDEAIKTARVKGIRVSKS